MERLRPTKTQSAPKPTLLLENLESLSKQYQPLLLDAIRKNRLDARILATIDVTKLAPSKLEDPADSDQELSLAVDNSLIQAVSTIAIRIPKLADRLEDLPLLAQFFLELCNRNNAKQVGSIRSDALDAMALYSWPGELDQLSEIIEVAHAHCTSHALSAVDLPPIFNQAFQAAAHQHPKPKPIVLDELLASIEKEAITRALSQAGGNKSEAAALLGMTRPRLYRRLVQLGFVTEETATIADNLELPEFIEQDRVE
jgi:DNA-binding NtrC family response regulator